MLGIQVMYRVKDATGRAITIRTGPDMWSVTIPSPRYLEGPGAKTLLVFGVLLVLVGLFLAIIMTHIVRAGTANPRALVILPSLFGFLWMVVFVDYILAWRRFWKALSDDRSRRTCCLVCGYDVKQLAQSESGMRICPECGAAWYLDPPQ